MHPSLPSLSRVMREFDLLPKKSLGQHFLLDDAVLARIVACAGDVSECDVIEIGPGPGGLTRSLLETDARHVIAVEKDSRCIAALHSLAVHYGERFTLLAHDALKIKPYELGRSPRKIIANLPYNIGSALLAQWVEELAADATRYASLTLLLQKEVAERIAAAPGSKTYGRLSVVCQMICDVALGPLIGPEAFTPPPKVDSQVVHLVPKAQQSLSQFQTVERIIGAAFSQRRKMLRSSLQSLGVEVPAWLERAKIDGNRRAETLSVAEFCTLVQTLRN